ncbi:MAG: hypothetical protein PHQ52_02540 [Candidatus Omnitrophica bacterium]|nr:hypothetical protein [Candidatus Omnitrophota bacterium]
MKKKIVIILAIVFVLTITASNVFSMEQGWGKGYNSKMDLKAKLFYKMQVALMNEEELGLTKEQSDKIKDIKLATQKKLIMDDARIDVIAIDIEDNLWKKEIDLANIQKLVDEKYDIKKDKTMTTITAYSEFKEVFSDEQYEQLKEKCKEMKMQMCPSGMMGPKK